MARRKKYGDTKPDPTVFGSASAGIRMAINTMAASVVARFQPTYLPVAEALRMVVRPEDIDALAKARRLTSLQGRGATSQFMLKFNSDKGAWAAASRISLNLHADDPACVLVPDYAAPTYWQTALGDAHAGGNLLPGASGEHTAALEHDVRDLIEIALDWALVEALFNYFDGKPRIYKKTNVRFLWSGIVPLLRHGGESCQTQALALAKVSEAGWCATPPEIYPAIRHANEVIARGHLLINQGVTPSKPLLQVGYAMPRVMCNTLQHPLWSEDTLSPKL